MATLLNDKNIRKLFETVILNADENCLRPNAYVLRLGGAGEFITTNKEFEIGTPKSQGIKIQPGHSVGITALEDINFSREAVHKIFPGYDLHAILSPSTDLSREGIVAPTTQIDAGYQGTLNWTIANTSSKEAKFIYGEKIYRMTILKLEEGETPDVLYSGDYQNKHGYIRSRRKGAPVGMKESQWIDAFTEDGPESMLDQLIKSGYPWSALGGRLRELDLQFKTITDEYSEIHNSITKLTTRIDQISEKQGTTLEDVRSIIQSEIQNQTSSMQDKWVIKLGSAFLVAFGLVISVISNDALINLIKEYGGFIGPIAIFLGIFTFFKIKNRKSK